MVENVSLNGYFGIDIGAQFVMCGWCSILNSFIKLFATLNSVFFLHILCNLKMYERRLDLSMATLQGYMKTTRHLNMGHLQFRKAKTKAEFYSDIIDKENIIFFPSNVIIKVKGYFDSFWDLIILKKDSN